MPPSFFCQSTCDSLSPPTASLSQHTKTVHNLIIQHSHCSLSSPSVFSIDFSISFCLAIVLRKQWQKTLIRGCHSLPNTNWIQLIATARSASTAPPRVKRSLLILSILSICIQRLRPHLKIDKLAMGLSWTQAEVVHARSECMCSCSAA